MMVVFGKVTGLLIGVAILLTSVKGQYLSSLYQNQQQQWWPYQSSYDNNLYNTGYNSQYSGQVAGRNSPGGYGGGNTLGTNYQSGQGYRNTRSRSTGRNNLAVNSIQSIGNGYPREQTRPVHDQQTYTQDQQQYVYDQPIQGQYQQQSYNVPQTGLNFAQNQQQNYAYDQQPQYAYDQQQNYIQDQQPSYAHVQPYVTGSQNSVANSQTYPQEQTGYVQQTYPQDKTSSLNAQQPLAIDQYSYTQDQQNYTQDQQIYTQDQQNYTQNQQIYTQDQQNYTQFQRDYTQDQQNYTQDQQSYTSEQQSYTQGQQSYTQDQQGYANDRQVYANDQQGYAQAEQGYPRDQQGSYTHEQTGYTQGQQSYTQGQRGYSQGQQTYGQGQQNYAQNQVGYVHERYPQNYQSYDQGYQAPQQYAQSQRGYAQGQYDYGSSQQGYNQNYQTYPQDYRNQYTQNQQGYAQGQQNYAQNQHIYGQQNYGSGYVDNTQQYSNSYTQGQQGSSQNIYSAYVRSLNGQDQYQASQQYGGQTTLSPPTYADTPETAYGNTAASGYPAQGNQTSRQYNDWLLALALLLRQYNARSTGSAVYRNSQGNVQGGNQQQQPQHNRFTDSLYAQYFGYDTQLPEAESYAEQGAAASEYPQYPQYNTATGRPNTYNPYATTQANLYPKAGGNLLSNVLQHSQYDTNQMYEGSQTGYGAQNSVLSRDAWAFGADPPSPDFSTDMKGNLTESQYEQRVDALHASPLSGYPVSNTVTPWVQREREASEQWTSAPNIPTEQMEPSPEPGV